MRTSKNLFVVVAAIAGCVILVWFSTSIRGSQKTYEVRPELTIGEYKTDLVRVIDAYERLMERYMDLTDRNISGIATDIRAVAEKLDSLDAKLTGLSVRTARIEKALGIERNAEPLLDARQGSKNEDRSKLGSGSQR